MFIPHRCGGKHQAIEIKEIVTFHRKDKKKEIKNGSQRISSAKSLLLRTT